MYHLIKYWEQWNNIRKLPSLSPFYRWEVEEKELNLTKVEAIRLSLSPHLSTVPPLPNWNK